MVIGRNRSNRDALITKIGRVSSVRAVWSSRPSNSTPNTTASTPNIAPASGCPNRRSAPVSTPTSKKKNKKKYFLKKIQIKISRQIDRDPRGKTKTTGVEVVSGPQPGTMLEQGTVHRVVARVTYQMDNQNNNKTADYSPNRRHHAYCRYTLQVMPHPSGRIMCGMIGR